MTRTRVRAIARRNWTADEIAFAAQSFRAIVTDMHGTDEWCDGAKQRADKLIAEKLGRSFASVERRRQLFGASFIGNRPAATSSGISASAASYGRPSDELIAARDDRLVALAQRDVTAQLCGDPAPGYSALDRRRP